MKLVLTGGGTGGHIYPALEVARLATEKGAQNLYLGSLRGQEGHACDRLGVPFRGFPSEPLYSLRSGRGVRAAFKLLKSVGMAKKALIEAEPAAVFSTGGYSAAPVVTAARKLGIPYVLLEANSIPGRANKMVSQQAYAVATVFKKTESEFPVANVIRTGMPIRRELRLRAALRVEGEERNLVLVLGGSQGSAYLNRTIPYVAAKMDLPGTEWLHVVGKRHYENMLTSPDLPVGYEVVPYLESEAIADAYADAKVVVARSGGTLAEFALFGLPSVLFPLPSAAGNHQFHNAMEFVEMGAASVFDEQLSPSEDVGGAIKSWMSDDEQRKKARAALKSWDVHDATERVYKLIEEAIENKRKTVEKKNGD